MAATARMPDCITLEAHRDDRHRVERSARWLIVAVLTAVSLGGLANVFGQRPTVDVAAGPDAALRVSTPAALRGGLLFQAKLEVLARQAVSKPTLVLDRGWTDAITVNTILPEPTRSSSERGRVELEFERLRPGSTLTVYVELQVNPTTTGRREQGVELRDGDRTIATVERSVTIFP